MRQSRRDDRLVSAGAGTTAGSPPTMSVPFTAPPAASAATKRAMSSAFETWYPATVLADFALPLVVLLGLPLLIGLTGSAREFDIVGGWRFTLWTLPDVGVTLLLLASVPLVLGTTKLVAVWRMAGQRA